MNNATTEQPLPTPGKSLVHDYLTKKFGSENKVIDDIIKRALKAQEKYKLKSAGLYTFNGRDALLDAYQEFCDLCIYMLQFEMEEEERFQAGVIDEVRISDGYVRYLLSQAQVIRDHLVEQGDFE